MRFVRALPLLGWGLVVGLAQARQFDDLFVTAKMNSMGRAMTAIVDDADSLFANPAGLAQMETWELRLPDIVHARLSPSVLDLRKSINNLGDTSTAAQISTALAEFDGKSLCGGVDLMAMGYYSHHFAMAVNPASTNACFRIRTPSALFARAKIRVTADSGLTLGFAQSFVNNQVRAGVALHPFLARAGVDTVVENTDILNFGQKLNDSLGTGWGFDFDVGMQGNLRPLPLWGVIQVKPMAGIVLQNAIATDFPNRLGKKRDAQVPPLERKVNAGVGASLENFGAFKPTVSLEARDLFNQVDDWREYLAAGVELALKPRRWFQSALRGHFFKGNLGGGFGVRLTALDIEMGTYAQNLGRGVGVGVDRVVYLQTSLVW
ncbi:MAG: hypothetical protein JST16_15745 [Bdellovibrionales bacterium]|nr:hypothetical protein [Bdellovibrionales bacterium]